MTSLRAALSRICLAPLRSRAISIARKIAASS